MLVLSCDLAVEHDTLLRRLLVLQLRQNMDEKLMAVVLHGRVEKTTD